MQQVSQAARRHLQAERRPQHVGDLRQRHAHLGVQLDDQRDDAGAELHAGRPQRIRGLQRVAALHPTLTLRAAAHFDVEAAHDRAHLRDFFLILRRHPGHFDRPAAVGTRRRHRRFQDLVNTFRARATRMPAVERTRPTARAPAAPLGSVLGEGGGLSFPRPARRGQLTLQVLDLPLLTLVLASQAVDLALLAGVLLLQLVGVALPPRQLLAKPLHLVAQASYPFVAGQPVLIEHTRLMPYFAKKYNPKLWILCGHPLTGYFAEVEHRSR